MEKINEIERKKWVISRVDRSLQLFVDMLKIDAEGYQKFTDKKTSQYANLGKGIFAGMVFLISLVLGIFAVDDSFGNPVAYVAIILILGIIMYYISMIFQDQNTKILSKLVQSLQLARVRFYVVSGYYNTSSAIIDAYTSDDYHKLNYYISQFVFPSLYIELYYKTKNLLKSRNRIFIDISTRNQMKKQLLLNKQTLDTASNLYENQKEGFEKNKLLEPILNFGNDLLDYKKGVEPTSKNSFELY